MTHVTVNLPKRRIKWDMGGRQLTPLEEHALRNQRRREPYSREQIIDHDKEYAPLFATMRSLCRHHDAMMRRGNEAAAADAIESIHDLSDQVLYQHRIWNERGRWNRYYRVEPSGRTHTSLTCRTINARTIASVEWELSGLPRQEVANRRTLCRHCPMDTGDVPEAVIRQLFKQHHLTVCDTHAK